MTSRTDDRRAARSILVGTSNGIRASASVRLARTIRWATVDSGARNARAISPVVRPPNSRRVSATRASFDRTGWQHTNNSRRRSSPMSSNRPSKSGSNTCPATSSSRPNCSCLRSAIAVRRKWSMARRFPMAMSHAAGLSGTPDSGHCSRAATSASWARSSATPMSRTIRARPAINLGDSILQTASMARRAPLAVTARRSHSFADRRPDDIPGRLPARGVGHLLPEPLVLLPELRREVLAEVLELVHGPDLHLGSLEWGPLQPFDGLVQRPNLPQPEPGHQLLRLGERPVDHGALAVLEPDADALRAGVKSLARQHHACLHQLLVEFGHLGEDLLVGQDARLGVLVGLHQHQHSHRLPPSGYRVRSRRSEPGLFSLPTRRRSFGQIDTAPEYAMVGWLMSKNE